MSPDLLVRKEWELSASVPVLTNKTALGQSRQEPQCLAQLEPGHQGARAGCSSNITSLADPSQSLILH